MEVVVIFLFAGLILLFVFAIILGRDNSAGPVSSKPSSFNSSAVPQQANEAFTKLFDTGMQNVLVLTQQNSLVDQKLRSYRSTIFQTAKTYSSQFVDFSRTRSFEEFEEETKKFIMLSTACGVYYGYELNLVYVESAFDIIRIIYNEIMDSMKSSGDTLCFFATKSETIKLIRARLDGVSPFKEDDFDEFEDFYHDMSDFEDSESDFDKKAYGLIDELTDQGYKKANSTLLAAMIATANLYWSQLPEGMATSRYASFECAVWSVFLCRFMLFSQLHKPREFIDAFSKDITEMLVVTTSREYGFDKKQVDNYVWERFAAYDKIMMSKRENSQKTDDMLDYLVDLILYETKNQKLVVKLDLAFIADVSTRIEAYHLATAFYEAVVTTGSEMLQSEYTLSTYEFIY